MKRMMGKVGKLQTCHELCYNDNPHTKSANQKAKRSVRQKEREQLREEICDHLSDN